MKILAITVLLMTLVASSASSTKSIRGELNRNTSSPSWGALYQAEANYKYNYNYFSMATSEEQAKAIASKDCSAGGKKCTLVGTYTDPEPCMAYVLWGYPVDGYGDPYYYATGKTKVEASEKAQLQCLKAGRYRCYTFLNQCARAPGPRWGATAFAQVVGTSQVSVLIDTNGAQGFSSRDDAINRTIARCAENNPGESTHCGSLMAFDTCGAIAEGFGGSFFFRDGDTIREAEDAASKACGQFNGGGSGCPISVSGCVTGTS